MAEVVWRFPALDDVDAVFLYISRFDPKAARSIRTKLIALGESLAEFPERGRLLDDGTREMTNVPPYILSYEVEDEHVFILSIRHGARQPDR